jgi:hypothetical protein
MSLKVTSSRLSTNDVLHGQGIDGKGQLVNWTAAPVCNGVLEWSYSPMRQRRPRLYTEGGQEVPWLKTERDASNATSDSLVNLKSDRLDAGVYYLGLDESLREGPRFLKFVVNPLGEITQEGLTVKEQKDVRFALRDALRATQAA